jgi:molybdenum cofactor cytidylyltransferase
VTEVTGGASHESAGVPVAAIVLAAGLATRMGSQKLLLPLRGRPILAGAVDAALGSRADGTFVVVGHEAEAVAASLGDRPVTVVTNPDFGLGLSTSLQAGLRAAGEGVAAAILLLGDQPFVTSALLDRLIARFAETGSAIVRPSVGGRPINPVLMSARLFPEVFAQTGDVGGREIVERHRGEICLVPVDDPLVAVDIDTIADYEAAGEPR